MVIRVLRDAAWIVRPAGHPKSPGLWGVIHTCIEGKAARVFERERRTTLHSVAKSLQSGTELYDRRADGSVLYIRIPPSAEVAFGIIGGTVASEKASISRIGLGQGKACVRPIGSSPLEREGSGRCLLPSLPASGIHGHGSWHFR
jgi:hypothetical protein